MTTGGEAAALTVAIIALVVSVVAAAFIGREAVTAHLVRTRPPRPRRPGRSVSGPRKVVGRSTTSAVRLPRS